jgi:hypothetical protein
MCHNIHWPSDLHWRTKKLISNFPILKSGRILDIGQQEIILEAELKWIEDIENSKEFAYQMPAYTKYRAQLKNAVNQLYYLG